jgi:hypothetical protein
MGEVCSDNRRSNTVLQHRDKKLRSIVEENSGNNRIILMNGTKTLIKRENFSKFLDQTGSI